MNESKMTANASKCLYNCIFNASISNGSGIASTGTPGANKTDVVTAFYCKMYPDKSVYPLMFVCFLAVLENVFTCYIIYTNKILRTATNVFVFSLCIADMLCAGVLLPVAAFCQDTLFYAYLAAIIVFTYAANLMAVTYERLISITKPLRYQSIVTKRVALRIALAAWIIPTCYCLLPLIWKGNQKTVEHKVFIIISLFVFLVTPFFFICFVYGRIIIEVHRLLKNNHHTLPYRFNKQSGKDESFSKQFKNSFRLGSLCGKGDAQRDSPDSFSPASRHKKRLKISEDCFDRTLSIELSAPDGQLMCGCLPNQEPDRAVGNNMPSNEIMGYEKDVENNSTNNECKGPAESDNDGANKCSKSESDHRSCDQEADMQTAAENNEENAKDNEDEQNRELGHDISSEDKDHERSENQNGGLIHSYENEHRQSSNETITLMEEVNDKNIKKKRKFLCFSMKNHDKDQIKAPATRLSRRRHRSIRLRDVFDEIRASTAFAAVAFTYMFTWIPVIYMTFMEAIGKQNEIPMQAMTNVNTWTIAINAAVDPLFYALILRNFRKVIKKQFRKLRNKCS